MLELCAVAKHFSSIAAVDNVSFAARPGEVTGYLGPNGSGKSTTIKMITGLMEMTAGRILFEGQSIHEDLFSDKRRIGYVPEEPHLYTHLSAAEYLTILIDRGPRRLMHVAAAVGTSSAEQETAPGYQGGVQRRGIKSKVI